MKTIIIFTSYRKKKRKPIECLYDEVLALYDKKEYKNGIELLIDFESKNEIMWETDEEIIFCEKYLNLKGYYYIRMNEYENAKYCFEQVLKVIPNSSQACMGLGECFFLTLNVDAAKTMLDWALKNDSENSAASDLHKKVNLQLGLNENHNSLFDENG